MNTGIQANGTTRVLAMTCVGLLSIAAVQLAFPAKRPDAPIVAGPVMMGMSDPVHDGIPQVEISRCHINILIKIFTK